MREAEDWSGLRWTSKGLEWVGLRQLVAADWNGLGLTGGRGLEWTGLAAGGWRLGTGVGWDGGWGLQWAGLAAEVWNGLG